MCRLTDMANKLSVLFSVQPSHLVLASVLTLCFVVDLVNHRPSQLVLVSLQLSPSVMNH